MANAERSKSVSDICYRRKTANKVNAFFSDKYQFCDVFNECGKTESCIRYRSKLGLQGRCITRKTTVFVTDMNIEKAEDNLQRKLV